MNILLLPNERKDLDYIMTAKVATLLAEKGVSVFTNPETFEKTRIGEPFSGMETIDYVITLGGDGTILNFLHRYEEKEFPPVFAINLGRVGCLTTADPGNYEERIEKLIRGEFETENRMTLDAFLLKNEKVEKTFWVVNEICLFRGSRLKMLHLEVDVNNEAKSHFYGDGVILSSPTGSTAYSYSAGGEKLLPEEKKIAVTPLCPQLRTDKPFTVHGNSLVKVSLLIRGDESREKWPQLELDGRLALSFRPKNSLIVTASKRVFRLIRTK